MASYFVYLENISFLVDASLVVLIWMVQLIIYPSFLFYKKENLIKWHQRYTTRIATIVVPLMFYQLLFSLFLLFIDFTISNSIYTLITIFLWIHTFVVFVPLHATIANGEHTKVTLNKLVSKNWVRTFLWSFLLIYHLIIA